MSFSLTSIRSSLFALSVVLSMPGNAAATLLKSCENIMSTNNIKKSQSLTHISLHVIRGYVEG